MFASGYARFNRTFTRKIVAMLIFGVLAIYKQKHVNSSKMVKDRLTYNQEHLRVRIGRFINFVNRVSRKLVHRTNGWVNRVEFFFHIFLSKWVIFWLFSIFPARSQKSRKNTFRDLVTPLSGKMANIWKTIFLIPKL